MAHWTDSYSGLPFRRDGRDRLGLDCWGLVRLVYAERLGLDLPAKQGIYADDSAETLRRVAAAMAAEAERWTEVEIPDEHDVVLMRRGALQCHVGIWVRRNRLLHVCQGIDSIVEPIGGLRLRDTILGYYRHADA